MGHSAGTEYFGGAYEAELVASMSLGLPSGRNGARYWRLWANSPGYEVTLPTGLRPGGDPQYLVVNDDTQGAESFDLVAGATTLTVDPGDAVTCILSSAGWLLTVSTIEFGAPLATGRKPFFIQLNQGNADFDLYARLAAIGWDETTPVAARVVLNGWLGATSTSGYAFKTGVLPAGSTLLLELTSGAQLTGKGGEGGRGGDSGTGLLAQPGSAGGTALWINGVDTTLISYGTIQGGGGGGGGGIASGGVGGGGGGGGCGYKLARGGAGGNPTLAAGGLGGVTAPGQGGGSGATRGGNGGYPGAAGSSAGAAGGAAGLAIVGTSTLTQIVSGTITGATSP